MTESILTFPVQFILERGKIMENTEPLTAVFMETRRNCIRRQL